MADLKKIQDCIDQITPLIEEVEALQPVTKGRFGGTPVEPTYLADDINALKEKVDTWHAVTAQILVNEVGDSNPQLFDFSSRWRAPIRAYDYKTSLKRKLERARSDLRILLAVVKEKGEDTPAAAVKPPKVFISHKTEDSAYAEALKNLINFIIIHSPRYYKSAVCLNEMGAAWALNTKFCSFLTKDCRIDQLTGVIGKEEICISPNADEETLHAHPLPPSSRTWDYCCQTSKPFSLAIQTMWDRRHTPLSGFTNMVRWGRYTTPTTKLTLKHTTNTKENSDFSILTIESMSRISFTARTRFLMPHTQG